MHVPTPARRLLRLAVALPLLALAGRAGTLWTVDAGGGGQFLQIQPAVDAAQDGDSIVVRAGSYAGFTISGKGLHVFADAGADVTVSGAVAVRAVPAGSATVLTALELLGPPNGGTPLPALEIAANPGHVRLQSCSVRGGDGLFNNQCHDWLDGAPAVQVEGSLRVAFAACELFGGKGYGDENLNHYACTGGDGASALTTSGSSPVLYDCALVGGGGGEAGTYGGHGGAGMHVVDFGTFASGSSFQGGHGGLAWDFIVTVGGDGGDGLLVDAAGQARLLDNSYAGGVGGGSIVGPPGASGQGQAGAGSFVQLPGAARVLEAQPIAPAGAALPLTVRGEPGDRVRLARAAQPGYFFQLASSGVWLVPFPVFLTFDPLGVVPASGVLQARAALPPLAAGEDVRNEVLQLLVVDAGGKPFLGSPVHVDTLRCSGAGLDCNANGVDDACDIQYGLSLDVNGNGVPDECEPTATWHVDAAAAPGGDGSAALPFRTIGEGIAATLSGDTVLVRDGVYTGAGNSNLGFGGREITVRSVNGPAACVIDLQGAGRAFALASGEGPGARIEGLKMRNGSVLGFADRGGAILLQGSSPVIQNCVFEDNIASRSGGAIAAIDSAAAILDCVFLRNRNASSVNVLQSGGGGVYCLGKLPRIERCLFVGNVTTGVGGGLSLHDLTDAGDMVRGCTFLGNEAFHGGGLALRHVFGSRHTTVIEGCLFAGNVASFRGGGLHVGRGNALLSNLTVVGNSADRGGGIDVTGFQGLTGADLADAVLWDNSAGNGGPQLSVHESGSLVVGFSDVQGGQGSVLLDAPSSSLLWGAGNIDADPLFADEDGPDNNPLTLHDNDYRLGAGSPCVDAGDNALVAPDLHDLDGDGNTTEPVPFDLDGNPRFVDDPLVPDTGSGTPPIVDMGAYERQ